MCPLAFVAEWCFRRSTFYISLFHWHLRKSRRPSTCENLWFFGYLQVKNPYPPASYVSENSTRKNRTHSLWGGRADSFVLPFDPFSRATTKHQVHIRFYVCWREVTNKGVIPFACSLSVLSLEQAAGSVRRGSRSTEEGCLDRKLKGQGLKREPHS